MGYRSEVKIATTREGYDQMCERVDTLSEGLGTSPLMGSCRKPDFFEESDVIIAGRLPRRSTLSCHTVPRRAASC